MYVSFFSHYISLSLNNLNITIVGYKSSYDVVILLAGPVVVDPTLYSSVSTSA